MGTTDNAAANSAVKNLQDNSTRPSPLSGSVGFGGDNKPDDVRKVSEALVANGRLDTPTSDATDALHSKIITAQQDMADGLKPDGLVKPGGPTENRFTNLVQGGMMKAPVAPTIQRPSTGSRAGNAAVTAAVKVGDVDAARAQALQNAGDTTRTSFQQAQDVKRLNKAKSDAAAASARAERADIKAREKAQHDQIMAVQKSHQQAVQQTQQQSKQIKGTTTKAIKGAVNLLENVAESSKDRHSRIGGSPTDGAQQTDSRQEQQMDSRLRGNDERGASDEAVTSDAGSPITDEVLSANRRSAQYLASRTGMQDFPRWEIEDINTQGASAITKTADLIQQTFDLNLDQAERLYERVIIGINPDAQDILDEILGQSPLGTMGGIVNRFDSGRKNDEVIKHQEHRLHAKERREAAGERTETTRDVERAAWINLTGSDQEVKDNLSALSRKYRAKGYIRASDNLDHFLNGKGAQVTASRDDARKDPFVRNAELENRSRFETRTFLGTSGKEDNNRELRSLQEGKTIRLNDHWDIEKGNAGLMSDAVLQGKAGMDDILADGKRNFRSTADFTATRQGETILIRGSVEHDGSEKYDFEKDGLGHVVGAKGLVKAGLGDNFDINRKWDQTFEGTVEVVQTPNGLELTNPRFKWSDMPPKRPKR